LSKFEVFALLTTIGYIAALHIQMIQQYPEKPYKVERPPNFGAAAEAIAHMAENP